MKLTQVGREGQELLTDEHEQSVHGGVTEVLRPVDLLTSSLGDTEIASQLGDVHLITLHRVVVHVVTVVGDTPAEVRGPEEGVSDL